MDTEAEIRAVWCLNVFKLLEVFGIALRYNFRIVGLTKEHVAATGCAKYMRDNLNETVREIIVH